MPETWNEMEQRHDRERWENVVRLMLNCFEGDTGHLPESYRQMAEVVTEVAKRHRVSLVDMRSPARTQDLANAQHVAFQKLIKAGYTTEEVASFFNRDHTTLAPVLRQFEARQ